MRAEHEVRLVAAHEPLHDRHHNPGKGVLDERAARGTARELVENVVEVRHEGQHRQVEFLHEPVDARDAARHEVDRRDLGIGQQAAQFRLDGLGRLDVPRTNRGREYQYLMHQAVRPPSIP